MIVFDWEITAKWVGDGSGSMSVPTAQKLKLSSAFGANGGSVAVVGDSPTSAQITTALNTVNTNAIAAFTAAAVLAQLDAWSTGGG